MKKLAIITTHPIQYNAPWFGLLTKRKKVNLKVFYTWGQLESIEKYDPDFDRNVEWDIPLTKGYEYTFVKNIGRQPGSDHFSGIDNPTLIKEIEDWQPHAVLVFGWSFKSHLKAIRHFKGKKTVLFRGDSTLLDEEKKPFKNLVRKLFLQWIYRHVDYALFVGEENRKYFLKMGLEEDKMVFAPHAVDNERFGKANCNTRELFGIPEDVIVILFSGKLEEKKDPLVLLDAFIGLNDDCAHLLFVGDGNLMKELKERVEHLETNEREHIHFAGFLNQSLMPSVYQSSDIFVLPSKGPGETWGLAVNEAMAAGCAVLVSDKCGCSPDLVKNGINGFLFKSGKTAQLTSLLKKMIAHKDSLKEMGKMSKEIISEYSFEKICMAIEGIMSGKTKNKF